MDYRHAIVEMIYKIGNKDSLMKIYSFVKVFLGD